jgi:flavodoxin
MKTIIYASVHHGNTKKVVEAIARECEVELIDATQIKEKDLSGYDAVGFASGIYYSKFHQSVLSFATVNLPENKKVFYICTNGGNASYKSIEEITKKKRAVEIGRFSCKGYDTFGPFKLVGGLAKGHPDNKDLEDAVLFFKGLE